MALFDPASDVAAPDQFLEQDQPVLSVGQISKSCPAPFAKIFRLIFLEIRIIVLMSRAHMRGVSPSSRHVGRGMRWTQRFKGEWFCCVRSSRVVLAPRMLAKSSWEASLSGATVTTSSLHREEHEVSRKAVAQGMSVCSPLPCMLVCRHSCALWHMRPRVQRAPGIPCALCFEGKDKEFAKLGQNMSRE
jgi:hypothetical protein